MLPVSHATSPGSLTRNSGSEILPNDSKRGDMTKTLAIAASMFLICTGPAGAGEDGLDAMDGENGASPVQLEAETTWDTDQTLGVVVHVPEGERR